MFYRKYWDFLSKSWLTDRIVVEVWWLVDIVCSLDVDVPILESYWD